MERAGQDDDGPARVRIRMLGPTRAIVDGAEVGLGGPRQRAVLARLAVQPGVAVSTDLLIDDLWGDDAPPSVVVTLQGYVSGLRKALGDPSLLVRRGGGYALEVPAEAVDLFDLERRVDGAERLLTGAPALDEIAAIVEDLTAARSQWTGEPWADHLGEAWTLPIAATAASVRRRLDQALVEAFLRGDRPGAALAELAGARVRDPLDEELALAEMTALYRLGRQAEALAVGESLKQRLLDELGLDPSPRVAALTLEILRHEVGGPGAPPAAPAPQRAALPVPVLPARITELAARRFVGRDRETDRLREAAFEAGTAARVVVVRGEPGIGKSALTARVVCSSPGVPVLWTRCLEDAVVLRQPLVELVGQALRDPTGRFDGGLLAGREALAGLVPELAVAAGRLPANEPLERWEIEAAIGRLLAELAAADGLVVVVDDAHWIDPSTASVLTGLLRDGLLHRVRLVLTRRTTGAVPNPALDELMVVAHREATVEEIGLGGLSLAEAADLLDEPTDSARVRELHRRCNGHPYHLAELARHDGDGLPASLRDVLGARLDALSPAALDTVRMVAVMGPTATLGAVAAASARDLLEVADTLDEAAAAGLLVEGDDGSVDTTHALVRDAVLAHAGTFRVSALHVRAAEALEAVGASPTDVARHVVAAGAAVPTERRALAALAAADHVIRQYAYREALQWCEVADTGTLSEGLRARVATTSSLALRSAGEAGLAREAARRGMEHARRASDPIAFAGAANMLALSHGGLGFSFEGMDLEVDKVLEEAVEWLPEDARRLRARMLAFRVANGVFEHRPEDLRSWSSTALDLVSHDRDPALQTVVLLADRLAHWTPDQLPRRLSRSLEAASAAQRTASLVAQATAQVYLVADLLEAGHLAEAVAAYRDLRHLARRLRQPLFDSFERFFAATFALLRGHVDRALRASADGLTRAVESQGANGELAFAAQTFLASRDRGELGGLVPLVADAAQRYPELGVWRVGLAVASLDAGDTASAAEALASVVHPDGRIALRADSMWLLGMALAADAAADLGDAARAGVIADALEPYAGRWAVAGLGGAVVGPVDLARGRALGACGRRAEALEALDAAVASCEAGVRVPLARALAARSVLRCALGDAAGAIADAERANRIAGRVGLVLQRPEAS